MWRLAGPSASHVSDGEQDADMTQDPPSEPVCAVMLPRLIVIGLLVAARDKKR